MSHHFRCSGCRSRNVLPKALNQYRRRPTCKNCGHDRFYVDKERVNRVSCACEGAYHWGVHRAGSPHCEQNPEYLINRAKRASADDRDIENLRIDLIAQGFVGKPGMHRAAPF